jgi:hypothetical protein
MMMAIVFDGIIRHHPEGVFRRYSEEHRFKQQWNRVTAVALFRKETRREGAVRLMRTNLRLAKSDL